MGKKLWFSDYDLCFILKKKHDDIKRFPPPHVLFAKIDKCCDDKRIY